MNSFVFQEKDRCNPRLSAEDRFLALPACSWADLKGQQRVVSPVRDAIGNDRICANLPLRRELLEGLEVVPKPGVSSLDRPAECSTFVLMEVETLGVARSLGWKVHMRCANGYRWKQGPCGAASIPGPRDAHRHAGPSRTNPEDAARAEKPPAPALPLKIAADSEERN